MPTLTGTADDDTITVTGGTTNADTLTYVVSMLAGYDHLIVDFAQLVEAVTSEFGPSFSGDGASLVLRIGGQDRLTYSGVQRLTITTGSGNDIVYGVGHEDIISTQAGNDTIHSAPAAGRDRIDGGAGVDTAISVDWSDLGESESVVLDTNGSSGVTMGSGATERYLRGIEQLVGFFTGAGNDSIILSTNATLRNAIYTGMGDDFVRAYGGATADGTAAASIVDLGFGTDRLTVDYSAATQPISFEAPPNIDGAASSAGILFGSVRTLSFFGVEQLSMTSGSANDTLYGTQGDDFLSGGAGNDELFGGDGDDDIFGDAGNDVINGLGGDDILTGGAGDDEVHGGDDDDTISELSGANDELYGEGGNDRLTYQSGPGAVTVLLDGGAGDDLLDGRGALDDTVTLNGGGGSDRILVGLGLTVSVNAGDDADLIQVNSIYAQEITLGAGADLVVFDDLFWEQGGIVIHDFAAGDAGDSINLVGLFLGSFAGAWTNAFGSGEMTLSQIGADAVLEIDTDLISGPSTVQIVLRNVQASSLTAHNLGFAPNGASGSPLSLSGSAGIDFLTGHSANDTIFGNGGNDVLFGAAGNDYLAGGDGADELYGQFGNDTLEGTAGDDRLVGNVGDDVLIGGADADRLEGGLGNDTMFVDNVGDTIVELAGEGYDVVAAGVSWALTAGAYVELLTTGWIDGTASINLTGNEFGQQFWGNNGVNILSGGDGYDELFGYAGDDDLRGEAGPDALFGGAGNDTLRGGLGIDTYFIDDLGDVVVELAGEGSDVLAVGFDYTLGAGVSVELMTTGWIGGPANIAMTGNELGNEIWGNDGTNVIHGGSGDVTDALFGFGGNDVLDGGGGLDLLIGGTGQDSFVFTTALDGVAADIVADFVAADDTILLDDAIFTGLSLGALNPDAFVTGTAALDANDRILYDAATGKLYFDADGNGAGAAIQFATLSGNPALSASDFMVI